jgi:hypothetical protein
MISSGAADFAMMGAPRLVVRSSGGRTPSSFNRRAMGGCLGPSGLDRSHCHLDGSPQLLRRQSVMPADSTLQRVAGAVTGARA